MKITSNLYPKINTGKIKNTNITDYAAELAQFHNWLGLTNRGKSLLPLIKDYSSYIRNSYKQINEYYYKTEDVVPSAEWYLDNYYLINELINELIQDLSKQYESKLKYFAGGDLTGYPRVYLLVSEYVKHSENELDFIKLREYIAGYQSEAPLSSAEIWSIPIMIKVILLEKIYYQVERILFIQRERGVAENWLNSVLGKNGSSIDSDELDKRNTLSTVFIETAARRLREHGSDAKVLINWLDNVASKQNLTIEKVVSTENFYLTSHGVTMGNIIATIKAVNAENWSEFFEGVSLVQQILEADPAEIFSKMDFESRDTYRHEIENLANKFRVSELTVAREVERLAGEHKESPQNHVGYYILGGGRIFLEKELTGNWGAVERKFHGFMSILKLNPAGSYFGLVAAAALVLFCIFLAIAGRGIFRSSPIIGVVSSLAVFLLMIEMAGIIINRLICIVMQPCFFPKLEFSGEIPEELKTMIVIPVIFKDAAKVREQLKQLEMHYLNNRANNLYFAILGDFADASIENMPGDNEIISTGIKGIKRLNKKYGKARFFYFHRTRKWNEQERTWMGWERKRGKLIEFNRLLLNTGETSFQYQAGHKDSIQNIKYVITLDADTILPKDSALRLIGTIAHPMHKAEMDNKGDKIISGYGIIQPRIGLTAESAFRTPFARMFTGLAGIDPYTCAISDIYQDLFGEGIFTGKGIYDLKVFHKVTEEAFPENTILSHDLIEGLYARTGLATDIELYDNYPTKYLSYTRRTHRWIRGDWQIARYLFNARLSFVSRWKIADNLRRSLDAPLYLLILFLSFTFLHDFFFLLTGLVLFSFSLPLLLNLAGRIIERSLTLRIIKFELKTGLLQVLFSLAVLPYQAYIQTDAIVRSIFRQVISKRLLLEWEPAADSEKMVETTLFRSYLIMFRGTVLSLIFLAGYYTVNIFSGTVLTGLLIAWLSSPLIAYKASLSYQDPTAGISSGDKKTLRKWARQIWAFFDQHVNEENNYLPPDNIQIEPYKGTAHRTSPTNIGLAMLANIAAFDLGYISPESLLDKTGNTLKTIKKMPKWNGHLYNWYDTRTLEPLHPIYISTVDSGNFAGYLLTLKNGIAELVGRPPADIKRIIEGIQDTLDLFPAKEDNQIESVLSSLSSELKLLQQEASLKTLYGFLDKCLKHSLFESIAYKTSNIPKDSKGFWTAALFSMVKEHKKSLEKYYPYIVLEEIPDSLKNLSGLSIRKLAEEYISLLRGRKSRVAQEVKPFIQKGLKNTVMLLLRSSKLRDDLRSIALGMNFEPLYHKQKKLFSIGYNLSEHRLDKSYYDLLASEARQTSLLAIAKGDVPQEHWFRMARPLTRIDGRRCLVSWSGTMFEFLMPLIVVRNYPGTLLDESYRSVIEIQRNYAQKYQAPWGISESGFFSFDIQNNYQYKAFGVPGLGLKRGLSRDMVISPYSCFMALIVDYDKSMSNLKLMEEKNFHGIYGLYEAIDFTPERVPYNEEFSLVKSYMSHHQGMSLIALSNVLNRNIMQKRFHKEPIIRAVEMLLQEQIPLQEYTFNPIIEETAQKQISQLGSRSKGEKPVIYFNPNTLVPRTSYISNREYSVMLTLTGSGYSKYNDIYINRWRQDSTVDMYGKFIYIQNLNSGNIWSAAAKPLNYPGENYKVTCFPNTVKYSRKDGNIVTETEVFVSPEDPVEIRKVSLTNYSQYSRDIQLTSYFEAVLDELSADMAHPAFSKLFIHTEFVEETLVCFRRPRHQNKKEIYLMHAVYTPGDTLGETEYETDRVKFIGRGRSLADPKAMDINQPLTKSTGAVLDPIMSLRVRVRVASGKKAVVYFITGIGDNQQAVLSLARKYKSDHIINQAKELAWSQNLMELINLDLSFEKANILTSLASQVIYPGPVRRTSIAVNNQKGQSALWPYSIPGDLPIVLLKIQESNQLKYIDQMLKIHEYWKIKGIYVDLVILNEDKTGYYQSIQESIHEKICISHVRKLVNKPGGVFLLKRDQLPEEDLNLLETAARIVFSLGKGSLYNQIQKIIRQAEQAAAPAKEHSGPSEKNPSWSQSSNGAENTLNQIINELEYYNGYGGFSEDGREYVIILEEGKTTPLPWVNVIANRLFGFLVTEAGASHTWSQNSRDYKLSPWSNDPLLDLSGEALYLKDETDGNYWSPLPQPSRDNQPYLIRHGQGYSVFEHHCQGISQQTALFVPLDAPIKIVELKLTNNTGSEKLLSAYYYLEWVLGHNREQNVPYLLTEYQDDTILCRNIYQEEFAGRTSFIKGLGGSLESFTCDRSDFIGSNRTLRNPRALEKDKLSGKYGLGYDPCAVLHLSISLQAGESKSLYFLLGDEASRESALALANLYSEPEQIQKASREAKDYWENLLTTIQISTPEKSFDLLFNRWLLYQTVVCRLWARSAFYQSGGAYGFRDQLQDVMSLAVIKPDITRRQIILHSSRQFPQGDVQHWWHPERGKGIRTKFSDDLLWLPFVTADYLEHSEDYSVLEETTPFIRQELLQEDEDERYTIPEVTDERATVYEHCVRAIDYSLKFGANGLPLIGTGDWNDGFSAVGREGKGESIWLGWFILLILKRFIPVCERAGDIERVERYKDTADELQENMEKNAWDGAWYRRAYYDDGSPLGSISSDECKIDSLAQSWAVISESARTKRAADAMLAAEHYLWDKEEGIMKLFTPPFDKTENNPGYIKGYIPGVRENGGQYTHAAIWVILAFAKLGEREKALELFNTLNPINHSRTKNEALKYKAEPYVISADIYTVHPNVGRGGWTWYTGAAGWMYQAALEGILGVKIKKDRLTITPCVPSSWPEYQISYRYKSAQYTIQVILGGDNLEKIILDQKEQDNFPLLLSDDGQNHSVQVIFA